MKNKKFGIIFNMLLPYESGRRPDVLLVSEEQVFVLEFKMKSSFYLRIWIKLLCMQEIFANIIMSQEIKKYRSIN